MSIDQAFSNATQTQTLDLDTAAPTDVKPARTADSSGRPAERPAVDRKAVIAEMKRISTYITEQYPAWSGFGPSRADWDAHKRNHFPTVFHLVRKLYGHRPCSWNRLLKDLGLVPPSHSLKLCRARALRTGVEDRLRQEPPIKISHHGNRSQGYYPTGLRCTEVKLPQRAWNPQTHTYDLVGHQTAYRIL